MWISEAYAQDATPAVPATTATTEVAPAADAAGVTPAGDPTQSLMFNLGFILLLFVFFYVLMIRPQQKRMKEQQTMLDDLKPGEKVITNGGIIGTVTKNDGNGEIELEIASGVKVQLLRYSVYKKYDAADFAPKADKKKA